MTGAFDRHNIRLFCLQELGHAVVFTKHYISGVRRLAYDVFHRDVQLIECFPHYNWITDHLRLQSYRGGTAFLKNFQCRKKWLRLFGCALVSRLVYNEIELTRPKNTHCLTRLIQVIKPITSRTTHVAREVESGRFCLAINEHILHMVETFHVYCCPCSSSI